MTNQPFQQMQHSHRRGSAILIVVGTLALIAVFAAIYISVGQGDQRVARSIQNKQSIEDQADVIATHILDVLAADRMDTHIQYADSGTIFTIRETTDAPYTDWTMRSESTDAYELFNPSGRHSLGGLTAATDFRVTSDPYLASTTPTYLGDPGQPATGDDLRPFASLIPGDATSYIAGRYSSGFLDNRDWFQITNIAPDGRFVNLFNLRAGTAESNGFGDTNVGGFDSESGYGTFTRPDGTVVRRMSEYLSLWKPDRDDPNARIQTMVPQDEGIWIPGRNVPESGHGITDDLENIPAVWSMYQRFMFMPINQPFMTVNRNGQIATWADPDYTPYQYADADGDGMSDSRWFELTAARDTQSGSSSERNDIERLYDAGRMRLFAAARIVDLSSMVNVNTALDQLSMPEPGMGGAYGATPADVDLRRLLSLSDVANNYSLATLGGLSPRFFHRPTMSSNTVGGNNTDKVADDDYFKYFSRAWDDPQFTQRKSIQPYTNALSVGRFAYDAIKRGVEFGETLDNRYYAWPPEFAEFNGDTPSTPNAGQFNDDFNAQSSDSYDIADSDFLKYRLNQFHDDPVNQSGEPMTASERADWYRGIGRFDPFGRPLGTATPPSYGVSASLYSEDDLAELLAFHGLNDPSTLSRLEKAAMGRMPSIADQNQRALSPLLSNRPLDLDRYRHGITEGGLTGFDGYTVAHPETDRYIAGRVAKESMAFFATTPRKLLTTVSGATHLLPGSTVNTTNTSLGDAEVAPSLSDMLSSPSLLFRAYSNALVGELSEAKLPAGTTIEDLFVEDLSMLRDEESATLFYGHRGPELALRVAAHTAANMTDLYDSDSDPTITTLIVDNSVRNELFNTSVFPDDEEDSDPTESLALDYPGAAERNRLDFGEANLPGDQPGTTHFGEESRRAVNIYGIEAMPILTETVSFYVYHDASDSAGGDTDYGEFRPTSRNGLPPIRPLPGFQDKITISSSTDLVNNPDCLMHGIAFQLHNPWDAPISLGGASLSSNAPLTRMRDPNDPDQIDTNANYQFDYYIEWKGYFFKLAEYAQYYPPSSSRYDLRSQDQGINGAPNPYNDFGPDDGEATDNGGHLDPDTYPDFVGRNVILQPGETRVFYAIADPFFDTSDPDQPELRVDRKWRDALSAYGQLPIQFTNAFNYDSDPRRDQDGLIDGTDRRGWTGPAKEWVQNQFNTSDANPPVMMMPMNPQTGEYGNEDVYYDYLPGAPLDHANTSTQFDVASFDQLSSATGRQNDLEVRLWKKITAPGEETNDTDFANRISENLLHNDMLVDRMSITSGLAKPISLVDDIVPDTASFAEGYPATAAELAANLRNDNTGYSLVRWASTSRRDSADEEIPGIGQVREWMLASRISPADGLVPAEDQLNTIGGDSGLVDNGDFINSTDDLNDVETQGIAGSVVEQTDYETHRTLGDLFSHQSVLVTASLDPYQKSDLNSIAPDNGVAGSMMKFGRDVLGQWDHPDSLTLHEMDNFDSTNQRPELITNSQRFNNSPRLADLLLAWGIGPTFAPTTMGSLNDNNASFYPDEWMTLTEALAIALGYEQPSDANVAADTIWANTNNTNEQLFDNGHLSLNNFVAYLNADTSEDPPEFNTGDDIRRGSGIPLALGVLDQARPISPIYSDDPATVPTFGLININTAPVEVLRLLPGLSPSLDKYYPNIDATTTESEWWANQNLALELPNLTSQNDRTSFLDIPDNVTPDVASLMVAYRDRLHVHPRYSSRRTDGDTETNQIRYSTTAYQSVAENMITELPGAEETPPAMIDHRDRATISGINGLRPTPGYESMGEILMTTISPDAMGEAGVWPHRINHLQLDIQQFGYDEKNLDGVSDTEIGLDPQIFSGDTNGATSDDYAERLALANSILNTISVRSDYFAVWFVVHAYEESDVTNLQPEDPLVPSIAKRYVMVVDRTNVKDAGDTPKVVFLKEVPM